MAEYIVEVFHLLVNRYFCFLSRVLSMGGAWISSGYPGYWVLCHKNYIVLPSLKFWPYGKMR